MSYEFNISQKDRSYLRELAREYLEYANLPIMEERKKLWHEHNSLRGCRPVIVMEYEPFTDEMLPSSGCETDAAKEIERNLMGAIMNYELINDDKVISPYYTVFWKIDFKLFGIQFEIKHAKNSNGMLLGYSVQHPILDLKQDFSILKPSIFQVDREYTGAWKGFVEDVIGDILPVRIENCNLRWHITPSRNVINLMGLETMMISMIDYPDEMHALYKFIKDDIIAYVRWQEKEGLLTLNNGNDYAGAGSYGFTNELPTEECKKTGLVTAKDLWANMNSQESSGISPDMYGEFIFPYYCELAKEFGLVYYGCCEPVHDIWEKYLSKLPGIRKVSVSPWCDEKFMGNVLKGSNVIYSRKPSPNFIGVDGCFDEDAFTTHITKTLNAAERCHLEFILRDIYTISGDKSKPGKAVKIIRDQIDKYWQ